MALFPRRAAEPALLRVAAPSPPALTFAVNEGALVHPAHASIEAIEASSYRRVVVPVPIKHVIASTSLPADDIEKVRLPERTRQHR